MKPRRNGPKRVRGQQEETTSPYFSKAKHGNDGCRKPYQVEPTSPHFLMSPSSSFGSLKELGSILLTWTELEPPTCMKTHKNEQQHDCEKCQNFIRHATRHFRQCPQFIKSFSTANNDGIDVVACSLENTSRRAEQSVRHLCSNRCYLLAYAASRDWVFLRSDMAKKVTDKSIGKKKSVWYACWLVVLINQFYAWILFLSVVHLHHDIDVLLQGWTCKLTSNDLPEGTNEPSLATRPPQTIFVSNDGKVRKTAAMTWILLFNNAWSIYLISLVLRL
jgi:hypothetical protein